MRAPRNSGDSERQGRRNGQQNKTQACDREGAQPLLEEESSEATSIRSDEEEGLHNKQDVQMYGSKELGMRKEALAAKLTSPSIGPHLSQVDGVEKESTTIADSGMNPQTVQEEALAPKHPSTSVGTHFTQGDRVEIESSLKEPSALNPETVTEGRRQ